MDLITKEQHEQLLRNHRRNTEHADAVDHHPVVKLFTPDGAATWLLTEVTPDGIAFGLCDLGMGFPELGYVSLGELREIRGQLGLPVERDLHFVAEMTLSEYAHLAYNAERIVT